MLRSVAFATLLFTTSAGAVEAPKSAPKPPNAFARWMGSLRALRIKPFFTQEGAKDAGRSIPLSRTGMGLGRTIEALRKQPFVAHPVALGKEGINYSSMQSFLSLYASAKPSSEATQARARSILGRVEGTAQRELGLSDKHRLRIFEHDGAQEFNAASFANGSIGMYRGVLDVADRVGLATAASKGAQQLMDNLWASANGTFEGPAQGPSTVARRYANAAIASVAAHELTHSIKHHTAIGKPGDADRFARAMETQADLGGLEMASRAGYSPKGMLALSLWEVLDRHVKELANPKMVFSTDHPDPIARYAKLYDYLQRRGDQPRRLYDGVNERRAGAPLLSSAQRAELAELPTPDAVRAFLAGKTANK